MYWRLMRRRLGLGDPLVADRFALWGVGIGLGSLGILAGAASTVFGWFVPVLAQHADFVISLLGLAAAALLLLAFMPPQAYVRWRHQPH